MAITKVGDSQEFSFTGNIQQFVVPQKGLYKLEVWGAKGGNSNKNWGKIGGYGGYSEGYVLLDKDIVLYIACGGGNQFGANFNGGGAGYCDSGAGFCFASGGGATHIALVDGTLESIGKTTFDQYGLIVAGGGGGAMGYSQNANWEASGGNGGGLNGGTSESGFAGSRSGGTQTSGYAFGKGETYSGGGGYYGGYAGFQYAGGGGSGWIGGVPEIEFRNLIYSPNTSNGVNGGAGKAKITFIAKSGAVAHAGSDEYEIYIGDSQVGSVFLGNTEIGA